jgi:hypothetical protein
MQMITNRSIPGDTRFGDSFDVGASLADARFAIEWIESQTHLNPIASDIREDQRNQRFTAFETVGRIHDVDANARPFANRRTGRPQGRPTQFDPELNSSLHVRRASVDQTRVRTIRTCVSRITSPSLSAKRLTLNLAPGSE